MTPATGTCHSSSCEATDRCTFSSGHSTAMDQSKSRTTPPRQADRLFATLQRHSLPRTDCREAVARLPDCSARSAGLGAPPRCGRLTHGTLEGPRECRLGLVADLLGHGSNLGPTMPQLAGTDLHAPAGQVLHRRLTAGPAFCRVPGSVRGLARPGRAGGHLPGDAGAVAREPARTDAGRGLRADLRAAGLHAPLKPARRVAAPRHTPPSRFRVAPYGSHHRIH